MVTFGFVTNCATIRYDDIKNNIHLGQARIEGRKITNQLIIERSAEDILGDCAMKLSP